MAHHPFSPSKLERLELCPGSFIIAQGAENREEEVAAEGTLLHSFVDPTKELDALSEEQKDLVESCRAYLQKLKEWYPEVTRWEYESPIKLVRDFKVLSEGTADLVGIAPHYIVVADWKFGYKETTPAQHNIQIKTYAAGKMSETHLPLANVHIHHPRLNRDSFGEMGMEEFSGTVERVNSIRETAMDTSHLRLNPSEKACEYCPGKSVCPAIKAKSMALTAVHSSQVINPEVMANLLIKAKMVKKWVESVEFHAKSMAMANGGLPGFKLRETKGHREISDAQKAFNLICAYMTPEEFMVHCGVSVASLETAFIAKVRKDDPKQTIAGAKSLFESVLLPVISRKAGSQSLVAL